MAPEEEVQQEEAQKQDRPKTEGKGHWDEMVPSAGAGYKVDPNTGFPPGVDAEKAMKEAGTYVHDEAAVARQAKEVEIAEKFDPEKPITEQEEIVDFLNSGK